ncbi:MAG: DUF86 domain-containing protein [Gammaproteobacteria bacterium]|nr:DUF86 domain-containing protein [Gammaproteobacteria bacterium]
MTDRDLIEKKLAFIETCISQLRELASPERIESDIREERFIAHTLQIAVQASLDVASHIVSARRLGEPETNSELFDLLRRDRWISDELTATMRKMAGFRNILVHGYQRMDLQILRDIVENRLGDLLAFNVAIKMRLDEKSV